MKVNSFYQERTNLKTQAAGGYDDRLDLSGLLLQPLDISARFVVEGARGNVFINSEWEQRGKQYVNEANGGQLLISVELGTGSLYLLNE